VSHSLQTTEAHVFFPQGGWKWGGRRFEQGAVGDGGEGRCFEDLVLSVWGVWTPDAVSRTCYTVIRNVEALE
jgi:hypothetical protein